VVNGQVVGSEKWAAKLEWMKRLRAYLDRRHRASEPLVLCGDFNVAPDERDVERPEKWAATVLFHPEVRERLRDITAFGLEDTFRLHEQGSGFYSWWDYRKLSFPKNDGLRLDLILATASAARACTSATIERNERKGQQASDHVPVLAHFDL
jgi:exodeoxyribonuclease-3